MFLRTLFADLRQQLTRIRLTLLITFLIAAAAIAFLIAFQLINRVPISHLTRDVPAVVNVPPWIGALSSMIMVFWASTAALCFLGSAIAGRGRGFNRIQLFFYWMGTATALLLFDDLFQIHEKLSDTLEVSEVLFFFVYSLPVILFVIYLSDIILHTDYLLLLLALGFFGFSLAMDVFQFKEILPYTGLLFLGEESAEFLLEDGAKFIGTLFWLAYFAHTSAWALQPNPLAFAAAQATPLTWTTLRTDFRRQLRTPRLAFTALALLLVAVVGFTFMLDSEWREEILEAQATSESSFMLEEINYAEFFDIPGAPIPPQVVDWGGAIRLVTTIIPTGSVQPGETIHIAFHLVNQAPIETNLNVIARVVGQDGTEIARDEGWPWGSPTSQWKWRDMWPDGHAFTIPAETAPGYYHVQLGFYDPENQELWSATQAATGTPLGELVTVGTLQIGKLPEPEQALSPPLRLGSSLMLRGVTLEPGNTVTPGSEINVRLFWQARNEPAADYTAFVHLLGPDGALVQPVDKPPLQGFLPTSTWRGDQRVSDDFALTIPADAAPGTYALYTGFYDPATMIRLPIQQGEEKLGDAFVVATLTVVQ